MQSRAGTQCRHTHIWVWPLGEIGGTGVHLIRTMSDPPKGRAACCEGGHSKAGRRGCWWKLGCRRVPVWCSREAHEQGCGPLRPLAPASWQAHSLGPRPRNQLPPSGQWGPRGLFLPPTLPWTFPPLLQSLHRTSPSGASFGGFHPTHPTVLRHFQIPQNGSQSWAGHPPPTHPSSVVPQPCWGCCPACAPRSPGPLLLELPQ